jgi:NAD(P)H dehydrogenase (quinone)
MNTSSNLLVLGVTGLVGRLVAKNLKRSDARFSVGTRRKANLEELADQFGASRFIDLDDPRTFDEALKHVTGIFLLTGYTVDMLVQSKTLIDAAKRHGWERSRRYKDSSRSRAIVAAGLGKVARH